MSDVITLKCSECWVVWSLFCTLGKFETTKPQTARCIAADSFESYERLFEIDARILFPVGGEITGAESELALGIRSNRVLRQIDDADLQIQ